MKYLCVFLLLLPGIVTTSLGASPIITYKHAIEKINVGNQAAIYIDTNHTYTIHHILSGTSNHIDSAAMPNLGLSDYVYWASFDFVNTSSENLILKFNQPLLNEVTFYRADGKTLSEIMYSESKPFHSRKYYYPSYAFDMDAGMGDTITYVLRFESNEPIIFDAEIANESVIVKEELQQELITGIFIGIIFVMAFYNLFIYFTVLDSSYLAYVFYIVCMGLTHITLPGYGFKYLWPNVPDFNDLSFILFAVLATIFGIEFLKQFLKTKQHLPLVHKIFSLIEIIFISSLIVYFTGDKILAFRIVQLLTFFLCFSMIATATKIIYMGYRPAVFFLTAWLVLLLSICIFIGKDFGIIPYNFFTTHVIQMGSSIEVILLSFALADKINILKKEKELSQTQALHALMQNKMILTNQNSILETKVGERTKEIENTNNELYKALAELKKAQTHLINTEKITSFAQLQTGTQHQTDNSINLIVSTGSPLKKDLDDIHELLDKYDMASPADTAEKNGLQTDPFQNKAGYQTIKEEMEQLFNSIEDGSAEKTPVIQRLQLSQAHENDLQRINLTACVDVALAHFNPEIFQSVGLVKNFSVLPAIECFPEKLSLAFTAILDNALDAIKEKKGREGKGLLIISTHPGNNKVTISIKDNGTGMTDEVKEKIFEPYAATTPIGKSAGLSMSTVFPIISDHNGTIELNTVYGKGTECIITLPVNYTIQ